MGADARAEANALVKRCEAVGWTVVRSGNDHWKVDTKRGTFSFASTPSSARSMRNAYAEAKRFGLDGLEVKLAKLRDVQRQVRIEEDRTANDAKIARVLAANGHSEPDDVVDSDVHLGFVDDVRIVAIAPALVQTPVMARPSPLRDAEELLLADGRICYRCAKLGTWKNDGSKRPDELCHAVFDSAQSLRNHIGYHSMTLEQITKIRSVPTKANRRQPSPMQTQALGKIAESYRESETETVTVIKPPTTLNHGETQELIVNMLEELSGAIFEIGGKLIDVRNQHVKIVELVKKIQPEVVEVRVVETVNDPELVAKAAKFDALRGLIQ